MPRNNMSRLGLDNKPDNHAPIDAPELSFISPTEMVDLPSKGNLYPEGHAMYGREQLEVRFMTAKEEDILLNENYVKNGIVLDRLVQSLLVDEAVKSADLLIGDKNAIIIAARISAYGNEYETRVKCPACAEENKYKFDLFDSQTYHGEDYDSEEIVAQPDGSFLLTLPLGKLPCKIRPLDGVEERKFAQDLRKKKKTKINSQLRSRQLKAVVVSVNDTTDARYIDTFCENVPARDASYIRSSLKKVTPTIDLEQEYSCSECGHEGTLEVPFNTEFFWPDQ